MANESYDEQLQAAINGLRAALSAQSLIVPSVTLVEKSDLSLVVNYVMGLQQQSKAPSETDRASEWKRTGSLVYRMNERGTNCEAIRVEMADGLCLDAAALVGRAQQLCALLNAA